MLERLRGVPSAAAVEGLLVPLVMARHPVAESSWGPLVFGSSKLDEEGRQMLLEIARCASDEVYRRVWSADTGPDFRVPAAWSKERKDWCRGFVAGMRIAGEMPADNLLAQSMVINLAALAGVMPFEEIELVEPQPKPSGRERIEQELPDMVMTLAMEITKTAMQRKRPSAATTRARAAAAISTRSAAAQADGGCGA